MNNDDPTVESTERIMALVRGELSTRRRWCYRLFLVLVSLVLALVLSLWTTEPAPLPMRTHVAFAAICSIALGWIVVLSTILLARNCPSAIDRLATAWMATVASFVFVSGAVVIALVRENWSAVGAVFGLGAAFMLASILLLRAAYSHRQHLREQVIRLAGRLT